MNKNFIYYALFVITAGCQLQQPDYLKMLSPDELQQIMQNEDVFLVDVHVPQQQHIKGTDAFIPYNQVDQHIGQLPSNKNTPIYLYCEGGPMGNAAAKKLHEMGYQNLFNLEGGAAAWKKAGLNFE